MTYVNVSCTQMPYAFTTQRLYAEKVTNDHVDYLTEILSNPQVQEAYNTADESTFTNIAMQLSIISDQWEQNGYGLYTIFDKESSNFIGFAGYHSVIIDEDKIIDALSNKSANEIEIYALFMPQYWRKGYGFEICTELIKLAFTYLTYASIIAYIEPKNIASIKLIKKLNFKEENIVIYNNKPHVLYRLSK